jgi:phosphatidate cytidylyltransferase
MSSIHLWSTAQQVSLLFAVFFGLLGVFSLMVLWLHSKKTAPAPRQQLQVAREISQLRAWWIMGMLFWFAWMMGPTGAIILFALCSFFALREFITLSPTHRADHWALALAFFVVLPLQYLLIAWQLDRWFGVFIPIYVFILIPVLSALGNQPANFLSRSAKIQWGIMVCVFGMSHVPALMRLDFPNDKGHGVFLVFFLVFVVSVSTMAFSLVNRRLRVQWRLRPFADQISQSYTWQALLTGVLTGAVCGMLLYPVTPFKAGEALCMALIASTAGLFGRLVMKAIKRDLGIREWSQSGTSLITGASGLLDRVDALCFAAPVFFHSVRAWFAL